MQRRLREGFSSILRSETRTTEFGIGARERTSLLAKDEAARDKLNAAIAELRKKHQAEFLKNLTPEQQAKYKAMVGEPFAFAQDQRGQGGPGGRGGQTGGGGRNRGGQERGGRPGGGRPQRPGQ